MSDIPDDIAIAACKAIDEMDQPTGLSRIEIVENYLMAERERYAGISVKPLEWDQRTASSPFCRYIISPVHDDTGPHWETIIQYQGSVYRRHETEDDAMASAQADYETRIIAALAHSHSQAPSPTQLPQEATVSEGEA